jgi:glutamine amidotransferase
MIAILDCGTGNLNSVKRMLEGISADVRVSSSAADIELADKFVIPGVGHFDTAISRLRELDLLDALNHAVLDRKMPVLGICLGMEILGSSSEEGELPGLGWIDAKVIRFQISDTSVYKVPHMGWNTLSILRPNRLLDGVPTDAEFYFAHAYHLQTNDPADVIAETEYESKFPSAIERGNIFGVQFHPEKSQDAGMRILRNFVDLS